MPELRVDPVHLRNLGRDDDHMLQESYISHMYISKVHIEYINKHITLYIISHICIYISYFP